MGTMLRISSLIVFSIFMLFMPSLALSGNTYITSDDPGGPAFFWIDISGATNSGLDADDGSIVISLPFPFEFFGTQNIITASSNGHFIFGTGSVGSFTNYPIDNPNSPNLGVFPWWDDWMVREIDDSHLYYKTIGTAPNRQFVLIWQVVYHYEYPIDPSDPVTFEVILSEFSNTITFQYFDTDADGDDWDSGLSGTIGLKYASGGDGLEYLFDGLPTNRLIHDSLAVKFILDITPPEITCPPSITVAAVDSARGCLSGTDWPGDYLWEEIDYEWESEIGDGLEQSDDEYDQVPIGFDFDFYGTLYSDIYIGSNGLIKFGEGSTDFSNSCIPSTETAAQNMIAPLWDDFNPSSGGDVYYKFISVLGSSPSRKFVVTWLNVPHYPAEGNNTFQVILYEQTGKIQFNYSELWEGNTPTVGVQLNSDYYTSILCSTDTYNPANPIYPSSILLSPPCDEYGMVEAAINPDIGMATATDDLGPVVSITNDAPYIFYLGDTEITWTATDELGNQASCTQIVTVVPPFGSICASVNIADSPPTPAQGVLVTVIDQNGDPVADPKPTDASGEARFDSIYVRDNYSVMVVTPLGYTITPSETQTSIAVVSNECTPVDFIISPIVIANDCRTIGYWKHQFNVYTSGRGNAQESAADLETYLDLVHQHFDILGVYVDLENFDFEDAKDILTVRGGNLMLDRAKQQLFAMLLNLGSSRLGQETVVSDDGRVAAEAVTLVAAIINDGDQGNDEMAKDICDLINNGQMVEAGIIPESNVRYKLITGNNIPWTYTLSQNYPNPFNAQTTIEYGLKEECFVTVEVYDLLGRDVSTLVHENQQAGLYRIIWDGSNCSSGMYFYKIQAGDFVETRKMILLK